MSAVPRVGGRLLIVDSDDRLLLIHERLEYGGTHWLTPGGGVEAGEQPRDAAVREAMEETGLALAVPADAEPVLITRREWAWAGVTYDQTDHFFLARVPSGLHPQARGLTDIEQQTLLGYEWWTVAALRHTSETLLPPDIGDAVARVLSSESAAG